MNLYIIRHGETDWNKEGLLQGSEDVPLNENGIELALKTKEGFQKDGIVFDKIFSSPYQRAEKTACIIAEGSGLEVNCSKDIREMGFGKYEGIKVAELKTRSEYRKINQCFTDPVNYEAEGNAESYAEVFARVEKFLEEEIIPLEHCCNNVLVVCHGAVLRAFICIFKKMPLSAYWTIHQPNCSVNIARFLDGNWEMLEESRLYYEHKADAKRGFV